jgi:hypothetical protein
MTPVTPNRANPRLTVEVLAQDCIDVRDLRKAGALKERWVSFPWIGFRCPGIRKASGSRYLIQIELHNQVVPQQIPVSWTPCNYSGARPWLNCICGRRVARLFKGFGGYFCRPCCGNPIYESQKRNQKARAYLKAYRARQQLGGSRPVVDPIPERPYRTKGKTYARLCDRIERLEQQLIGSRVVHHAPLFIRPLSY